jgi:uncharacterized protein YndB with AHSA1/START domain
MSTPDLEVSVDVRRPAAQVWAAVADPNRFVSWSPEANAVSDASSSGPLPVGATFSGANRHGMFRWTTRCRVVESTPAEAFAFEVTYLGLAVARWRYSLTPQGDTTHVAEQWWDQRGTLMKALGTMGTGVRDRRTHNEITMRATLAALTTELEET